jgi:zinc transporter 2
MARGCAAAAAAAAAEPLLPQPAGLLERPPSLCALDNGASSRSDLAATRRRLAAALSVAAAFTVLEFGGGYLARSLALMSDAAHMLSDVAGFAIALLAAHAGALPSSAAYSFGYSRAEVLAALASVASVWVVTGALVYEAARRVARFARGADEPIDGRLMFLLALAGVGANLLILWCLDGRHYHFGLGGKHAHAHGGGLEAGAGSSDDDSDGGASERSCAPARPSANLNLRGAVAHAFGDLLQSAGVAAAGALIWASPGGDPRWRLADPAATFLSAGLAAYTTRAVLRDVADVLMERAPRALPAERVRAALLAAPGVARVDDLHVWSLSGGVPLLAAHVALAPGADAAAAQRALTARAAALGVAHATFQLDAGAGA